MKDRKTILIVDDESYNLNLLKEALKQDFKLLVALNGEEALSRAQKKPDLILLDIILNGNMDGNMDGYEVCRRLKENDELKHIPVIFVTAMSDVGYETKGLQMGAVDYITKPLSPDLVRVRVSHHLEKDDYRKMLEKKVLELEEALAKIKTLKGLLPICAHCKKIRDDKGYWTQIEEYIKHHSDAEFSHGICPKCREEIYGKKKTKP